MERYEINIIDDLRYHWGKVVLPEEGSMGARIRAIRTAIMLQEAFPHFTIDLYEIYKDVG